MDLITGGTGFLGAHLAANMLLKGKKIRILKRPSSSLNEFYLIFNYYFGNDAHKMIKKIDFVDGDITDIFSIEHAISNIENVYHCAGFISYNKKHKEKIYQINVKGTENLINVLLNSNIRKLCHVSSIASLGYDNNQNLITEDNLWFEHSNKTSYGLSKYNAEKIVWAAAYEGLNTVIVNPGIILGVGDFNKGACRLFKLVKNGLKFYTKGVNGFVDVRDVVEVMIKLTESDISGERFILVAENISFEQLLKQIAKQMNVKPPTIPLNSFSINLYLLFYNIKTFFTKEERVYSLELAKKANSVFYYSSEKIKKVLNYEFIPLSKTIEEICNYYQNNL